MKMKARCNLYGIGLTPLCLISHHWHRAEASFPINSGVSVVIKHSESLNHIQSNTTSCQTLDVSNDYFFGAAGFLNFRADRSEMTFQIRFL